MNKLLSFVFIFNFSICLTWNLHSQSLQEAEIISFSKNYYVSFDNFQIKVSSKSKSSIAEDTIRGYFDCYINLESKQMLFDSGKVGSFIDGKEEYIIFFESNKYKKINHKDKKFTAYYQRFIDYPFVNPNNFFAKLERKKLTLNVSDTSYFLKNYIYTYEFRKSDFSIASITETVYDKKYNAFSFEKIWFSPCLKDSIQITSHLDRVNKLIFIEANEKLPDLRREKREPEFIDLSFLNAKNLQVVNGQNIQFKNKLILLDFFYQGCLPCLKSHPVMNDFFEKADSGILVIGIDHKFSDTVNIEKYIDRHRINYPVILGNIAKKLADELSINIWPTFVIIDFNGKVLEYQAGLSNSFFRRVRKKYF